MILSLLLVIAVISYLEAGSFRRFIDSKSQELGLTQAPLQNLNGKSESFRICHTRVESVEWSNHARIFEDKSKAQARWLSQVPATAPSELNALEVEKWFGINCVVKIFKSTGASLSNRPDDLLISFVDGSIKHIKRSGNDFLFDNESFRSPELASSLSELYRIGSFDLAEPK